MTTSHLKHVREAASAAPQQATPDQPAHAPLANGYFTGANASTDGAAAAVAPHDTEVSPATAPVQSADPPLVGAADAPGAADTAPESADGSAVPPAAATESTAAARPSPATQGPASASNAETNGALTAVSGFTAFESRSALQQQLPGVVAAAAVEAAAVASAEMAANVEEALEVRFVAGFALGSHLIPSRLLRGPIPNPNSWCRNCWSASCIGRQAWS